MTIANESEASPDADSSTFGLPGGVSDTETEHDLCKTHRNTPSRPSKGSVGVGTPEDGQGQGRGVYRLGIVLLVLVVGILTDSRRLVDAASLML